MIRLITLTLTILLLAAAPASAYSITGPDSDGRYATIHNVIASQPAIARALPASLEIAIRPWSFGNGAKTSVQSDGHIRIDIGNTLMNPAWSSLIAHELGHVIEISHPGLMTAWQSLLTARGYGPSTWRVAPQYDWWRYSPSENFAENFRRCLYWPWYSGAQYPDTALAWFDRVGMWAFLAERGIR
jgi:hypothetical protein